MDPIFSVLALAVIAPIIGSFIGVMKKPTERMISNMLSFAAGIMLAISFLELIPESIDLSNRWICIVGIMAGALLMFFMDRLLPHIHPDSSQEHGRNLNKTSWYLIAGIALHNLPEGMAIAIGSVTEIKTGLVVALAIAIHNIPEGICTSAPLYHSTGKRLQSFLVSSLTAVPVLIGFLIANYLYMIISINVVGFIVAATAGLMIYICADELIPTSCSMTMDHGAIFSLIIGVLATILLNSI